MLSLTQQVVPTVPLAFFPGGTGPPQICWHCVRGGIWIVPELHTASARRGLEGLTPVSFL